MARCFAEISPKDVRAILTENPARIYGFDASALQPVADRVRPRMDELSGVPEH